MKAHVLLTLGLSIAAPSLLFAQTYPEPVEPAIAAVPRSPRTPGAPRAALAPVPALAAARTVPAAPPAPEPLQAPVPKPAAAPAPLATPAVAPMPPAPPRPPGQMINVRIDVTLSDSKGTPKTLTMTVADGESGMNRTTSALPVGQPGGDYSFNADAGPTVVGNKIRLRLTADAVVPVENEKANGGRLGLRQSQTLILSDGQSVEIARAADPVSDRAFVLTVKATIQR
jgi:hypothetical protein